MGKALRSILMVFATLFVVFMLVGLGGVLSKLQPPEANITKDSILLLKLDGVILDTEKFTKDLKKYAKKENIKGVIVKINSPGGAVGPSQELYFELMRVRDELQKPVVVSTTSLMASGGYYAAVGADQIVTTPGAMLGSIGVIIGLANLEDLYKWMKIKRFAIKTGQFKDAGAEYRKMSPQERALFQNLIDEVHAQFKAAVVQGRKLSPDLVEKYSDGRVFTGETAVKLGFADQIGTYEDALRIVGELAGLGTEPEVFEPPEDKPNFLEMLAETRLQISPFESLIEKLLHTKLTGQPMLIMEGAMGY